MIDYITLNNTKYPIRELRLNEYEVTVRISSESLESVMKDAKGEYTSRDAQLLDEIIFFYVPDDLAENGSDEEVEQYVINHLEW